MEVLGTAGAGLLDPEWLSDRGRASVGYSGEKRSARLLHELAADTEVTILHDLTIPGSKANIDHVVVAGDRIHLIDSKVWRPGFYWTLGAVTRRGLERFPPADKRTLQLALDRLRGLLLSRGVAASFAPPRLLVWPSAPSGALHLWAMHAPGNTIATDASKVTRRFFTTRKADSRIVQVLRSLL